MEGVTDHVYRGLMTEGREGKIAFCVTEYVRVTDHAPSLAVIVRSYPELASGGRTRSGVPVILQLLGGDAQRLAASARWATQMGVYGIDLNFGCPAKLVNRHDGGACLLKTPERIRTIVARVRDAVAADRPVSAKIRLGWECHDEVVPIARAAAEGGASWLTIHGRTRREMYGPPADWLAIGRARAAVNIPVIANGDLNTEASFARCAEQSGCVHYMLGRGPMGRPSLVGAGQAAPEKARLALLLTHYLERLSADSFRPNGAVGRVKQWLVLASKANPDVRPLFERTKRLQTCEEMTRELASELT
jgi:tRNA-dihydrouridine synthase C